MVVREINQTIMMHKANYVLEADIKGFFDNVNHDWLMKFLENDIADKNFLRYVKRFLIAGVMEGIERKDSEKGTPQGGQISPVLANVYCIMCWICDMKRYCENGAGVKYITCGMRTILLIFQYENEARQVMEALKGRLGKFGLELAEDKTRILPIGRLKGTKEGFDFLGFTFFNTKTRGDRYRLGVQTSKNKLKTKKQTVKA